MINSDAVKEISNQIIKLVPDDPQEALTVLAINYAHVAVATGCDDESAITAIRRALVQMRRDGNMLNS